MNRRGFLTAAVAAPVVILTPGLLMKVKPLKGWTSSQAVMLPNEFPGTTHIVAANDVHAADFAARGVRVWLDEVLQAPGSYVFQSGMLVLPHAVSSVRIETPFVYQGQRGISGSRLTGPFFAGDKVQS